MSLVWSVASVSVSVSASPAALQAGSATFAGTADGNCCRQLLSKRGVEPAPAPESRKFSVPRGPDLSAWTPRGGANCSQTLGDRGGPTDALSEATSIDPEAVTGRAPPHARPPGQDVIVDGLAPVDVRKVGILQPSARGSALEVQLLRAERLEVLVAAVPPGGNGRGT